MYIEQLKLTSFRNISHVDIPFCKGINLLIGNNAQGKTNIIEGIFCLALAASFRTSKETELITYGQPQATIFGSVQTKFGSQKLAIRVEHKQKLMEINAEPIKKVQDFIGNVKVILFTPDELRLLKDGPEERRAFLDRDISQLSPVYYHCLLQYQKVLNQRNKLLKFEKNIPSLKQQLEVWDAQLAHFASRIIITRRKFISRLSVSKFFQESHLSGKNEKLSMAYIGFGGDSAQEIEQHMLKSLQENLQKDIELGYTSIGPHRDDVKFCINGEDAKIFASQGQQRSIVLSLKLAEMDVFYQEIGEYPILILDDVFSELDAKRQKALYEILQNFQTIITGTSLKFKPQTSYQQIKIKNGAINAIKYIQANLKEKEQ